MKRTTYCIMAAALLTAGALLTTACSNEDDAAIENTTPSVGSETIQFTATLAPKGDDGTTTRAITVNNQGTASETLTTTWAVGEFIAIYYEDVLSGHTITRAVVETVNADGSATISATFNSNQMPKDGGKAKFMYPSYLMDTEGNVNFEMTRNGMGLCRQYGNLTGNNSISLGASTEYRGGCDLAIGYGTMSVSGSEATISGSVSMENEVCICKFHFALDEGTGMGSSGGSEHTFSPVIINDGDGHTYTIVSDRPDDMVGGMTRKFKSTDDIYVALLPISGKTVTFSYTETTISGQVTYACTKTTVTLEKGKFYRNLGTITLVRQ